MKQRIMLFSLLVGAMALAHCGGDDTDNGGAGGADAAPDGSSRGGGGTAGARTDAGTDSKAETDSATAADGATPDTGVPTADTGVGDAPATCPAAEPANASACSVDAFRGQQCTYGTTSCRCRSTNQWLCTAADASVQPEAGPCPESQPAFNASCATATQTCTYGVTSCTCQGGGGGNQWRCNTPTDALPPSDADLNDAGCPISAVPANGSYCPTTGINCIVDNMNCRCHTGGAGTAHTWTCSPVDGGRADTGSPDTGTADTGTVDAETVDTGTVDTGTPEDSGAD